MPIVSPVNFYYLFKGDAIVKLKKGMSREEVIDLLGEPCKITNRDTATKGKFGYKIDSRYSKQNNYEMLFNDNVIEWVLKTKIKI